MKIGEEIYTRLGKKVVRREFSLPNFSALVSSMRSQENPTTSSPLDPDPEVLDMGKVFKSYEDPAQEGITEDYFTPDQSAPDLSDTGVFIPREIVGSACQNSYEEGHFAEDHSSVLFV